MDQHPHGLADVAVQDEPFAYYGTERSASPHWVNEVTAASLYALMTLDVLSAGGWELLGPPAVTPSQGGLMKEYLLRRPKA